MSDREEFNHNWTWELFDMVTFPVRPGYIFFAASSGGRVRVEPIAEAHQTISLSNVDQPLFKFKFVGIY